MQQLFLGTVDMQILYNVASIMENPNKMDWEDWGEQNGVTGMFPDFSPTHPSSSGRGLIGALHSCPSISHPLVVLD